MSASDTIEDELIAALQKSFRLTRYEAKLYLALLKGASNPREASSMSGVPLPRIYDVIRVLESKGFVVATEGWYRPLPPSAVAIAEIARIEDEARKRVNQILEVARALESIASAKAEELEISVVEGLYPALSAAAEDLRSINNMFVVVSIALSDSVEAFHPLLRDSVVHGVNTVLVYSLGAKKSRANIPDGVKVVEAGFWLPDLIATDVKTVYIVPDRRSRSVKGIFIKDRSYSSYIIKRLRESLRL